MCSHAVNGVAALHTELLKHKVLRDFYELWKNSIIRLTGRPRRWLLLSNLKLAQLITQKIGNNWIKQLDDLKQLETFADAEFRNSWRQIKHDNKQNLVVHSPQRHRSEPRVAFDVQVKRIHEYKRQLLNALYVITLYNRIKGIPLLTSCLGPSSLRESCAWLLHGQAIIKLINSVADVVNTDPVWSFEGGVPRELPVSLGQLTYLAADLGASPPLVRKPRNR